MKKKILRMAGVIAVLAMTILLATNSYATDSIDEAKKKKEEMEQKLKDTEAAIKSLESIKNQSEQYINKMDTYITNLTNNIYSLQQQSNDKQAEIDAKQAEIDAKLDEIADMEEAINSQYADMKLRIQYMYENGEVSYISMFFESEDMSDMLNRAEYLSDITEHDRKMLDKLEEDMVTLRDMEAALEEQKSVLSAQKEELEQMVAETKAEQDAVEVLVESKKEQLEATENSLSEQEKAEAQYKKEIAEQEAIIKELEEIERKRQEAANSVKLTYDGGKLIWPLPGYSYISSAFGYRIHPKYGYKHLHSGIDIPAPAGTNILCAYKGQVAWAGYNWSAGNWVGVDHGNGLYTIYMHMSKILVTEGQMLNQGDVVGLVGTTGSSTGNHLHFSVRINGTYVQPLDYVTRP